MSDVQAREWDSPPASHGDKGIEDFAADEPVAESAAAVQTAPEPVLPLTLAAEAPAPTAVPAPAAETEAMAAANDAPEPAADPRREQFFAGAGVRFKGELEGSDELLLSGAFEGTAKARKLVVSREGRFSGTCVADEAEIEGVAEGTLTVTGALIVRAGGVVRGKISYGEIELERGAHLEGEVVRKLPDAAEAATAAEAPGGSAPAPVAADTPLVELSVADIVVVPNAPTPRVLTQDADTAPRRRFGIFGARR